MKKHLFRDEFEELLSESAEELRMYPSDRVWTNLQKHLRHEQQWPALTFGSILIGALMLAALIFVHPSKEVIEAKQALTASPDTKALAAAAAAPKLAVPVPVAKPAHLETNVSPTFGSSGHTYSSQPAAVAATTEAAPDVSTNLTEASDAITASEPAPDSEAGSTLTNNELPNRSLTLLPAASMGPAASSLPAGNDDALAITPPGNELTIANASPVPPAMLQAAGKLDATARQMAANMTARRQPRWSVQYYATPSLSYRMLAEERRVNGPVLQPNLDHLVQHAPKLGIEAGVAFLYSVSDRLRLKTGLQLNYRQYAIDAYSAGAMQATTIRFDQGGIPATIPAFTDVSAVAGNSPITINNRFFQVGIPVGFELTMARLKQSQFVIASTFQPTYNVGKQGWLISADYRNYVKENTLFRNWNINAGIEAFLRFKGKGNLMWQVGPQIRYQMLPAAVSRYPIREHLIDYGFKIGVMKTLQ
jgi:hypothetical protein